jgi:transcriptional regulator with XRE-family HTH domain
VTPDEDRFYKELGQRIAHLRIARDLTQQRLADALGIAQPTLGHYEVGRNRMAAAVLVELSTIFGITVDELLGPLKHYGKPKSRRLR